MGGRGRRGVEVYSSFVVCRFGNELGVLINRRGLSWNVERLDNW